MLRLLRKGIFLCGVLLAAAIALKCFFPEFGREVGHWISGEEDNRISQAVSRMVSSLADGDGIGNAVEVFCENIGNSSKN